MIRSSVTEKTLSGKPPPRRLFLWQRLSLNAGRLRFGKRGAARRNRGGEQQTRSNPYDATQAANPSPLWVRAFRPRGCSADARRRGMTTLVAPGIDGVSPGEFGLVADSRRIENRRGCSPRLLVSAALIYLIVIVVVTTLVILKLLVAFKVMVCLPGVRLSTYNVSPPPNSP